MNILITGCAGFIGFHTALIFLNSKKTDKIYGIDNLNDYYDIKLKLKRLSILKKHKNFFLKKLIFLKKKILRILFIQKKFLKSSI